jgi:hypothetical protein
MSKRAWVIAVVTVVCGTTSVAWSGVVVTDTFVSVRSTGSAGRLGSATGTLTQEQLIDNVRSPVSGITVARATSIVAGPVAAGPSPSLPGTTAVVQTSGSTSVSVTPAGATTTLQVLMNAVNTFTSMDAGVCSATTNNFCDVEFRVDAPTPYALTGNLALDDQDVTGLLQLQGTTILLSRLNNGAVNRSGTLQPGTYRLRASCNVSESLSASGSFAENGSIIVTLTLQGQLQWPGCDGIDFNNNGVFPEDQDVIDFFSVLAGGDCAACADIDFNNNSVFPEDQDVIDFFTTLAGGDCVE